MSHAQERKLTGTFESVPLELLMGLRDSKDEKGKEAAEKRRDMMEMMKQTVTITEQDLTMSIGSGGSIYMTYTTQGDFLLGKTVIGNSEMFYPIYVKDADTLFLAGQKFIRKTEAAK